MSVRRRAKKERRDREKLREALARAMVDRPLFNGMVLRDDGDGYARPFPGAEVRLEGVDWSHFIANGGSVVFMGDALVPVEGVPGVPAGGDPTAKCWGEPEIALFDVGQAEVERARHDFGAFCDFIARDRYPDIPDSDRLVKDGPYSWAILRVMDEARNEIESVECVAMRASCDAVAAQVEAARVRRAEIERPVRALLLEWQQAHQEFLVETRRVELRRKQLEREKLEKVLGGEVSEREQKKQEIRSALLRIANGEVRVKVDGVV